MRSSAAMMIVLSILLSPALAQTTAPAGRPHPAPAVKLDPKKKVPPALPGHDPNAGLAPADRVLVQLDLAWTGYYNGLITGEFNDRTVAALKAFQKDRRLTETGSLTAPERASLAAASKAKQEEVGWRMVEDKTTGAEIGLPTTQVPNSNAAKAGTRWSSGQGQIQVETFRIREPGTTLADVYDTQKKQPAGRQLEVNLLRDDFFILSGMQGLKRFYVRAAIRDGEVRGMTLLYDQATEGIMDPVAVVMSSAFAPFPGTGLAALIGTPAKRKVEYATGILVSQLGHIVTDAQATAGCDVVEIAGHGDADRVAQDEATGLALLRIYGADDLAPAALAADSPKGSDLTLLGIADPQMQDGGNAVSRVPTRLDGDALTSPPPPGFDGAAVLDGQGHLIGMVALKEPGVAGASAGYPPRQAGVVPGAALAKLLMAQSVAPAADRPGIDAVKPALVRVICVRR